MAVDANSKLQEEQLYMFEMLVDRLNINSERIEEIGSTPLCVRLEFLDFPAFKINEDEFYSSKKLEEKAFPAGRKIKDGSLDFSAGKSCLFPKKPSELIDAMRSETVKIGVYKVMKKEIDMPDDTEILVCKSEVPLVGCLCDQVAMARNDASHLPKPYTLRNTWNLIDEDGKPSGTILLFLRLTCLGKSVVTEFAARDKFFLFKTSNSPNEFQCSRVENNVAKQDNEISSSVTDVPADHNKNKSNNVAPRANAVPRSVIGLASICQELAKRDGGPLNIALPTELSNRQRMVQETASKNDIVDVPNMENSECIHFDDNSMKGSRKDFPCGSASCAGGLCAGKNFVNQLCRNQRRVAASRNPSYTGNNGYTSRMRGGGRWDKDMSGGTLANSNFQSTINSKYRECGVERTSVQSLDTLIIGACKTPLKNAIDSRKPGCGCYGKLGTGVTGLKSSMSATQKGVCCSNKPCQGVDCLIRAFKETQDFVDSIGKVPGLVGLGLMDPMESPFFGRDKKDEATTSCGTKVTLPSSKPLVMGVSSVQRFGLKNQKTASKFSESKSFGTIKSAPGTGWDSPSGYHDYNVPHLETVSLTSAKLRKKAEDKIDKYKESQELLNIQLGIEDESRSHGEPRSKSRKRKTEEEIREDENASTRKIPTIKKKLGIRSKSPISLATRIARTKQQLKLKSNSMAPELTEDRDIKVSKRIIKMVRAIRNPMLFHGHKSCLDVRLRVPRNMGWLWNTSEVPGSINKPPLGWKPGAISKFVWNRLQEAKATTTESTTDIRPTTPSRGKRLKGARSKSFLSLGRSQWMKGRMLEKDDNEIELPPTLHIHRKDGTYYVTMYPIKQEDVDKPELQEAVKPLQFKITKDKDNASAASSSTASDMEIEFSPPAAISRYKKKIAGKDRTTQVTQQEILDVCKVTKEKPPAKAKKEKTKK